MKPNFYDTVLDKVLERVEKATGNIDKDFKGVKPFDKEPVSTEESIYNYSKMTPEMEQILRQAKGDAYVDEYKVKMEKMLARRGI